MGILRSATSGANLGGILAAKGGWDAHEDQIQDYEQRVQQGKLLLVVHGNPPEVTESQRVLRETPAQDIHFHAPSDADAPEADDSKRIQMGRV